MYFSPRSHFPWAENCSKQLGRHSCLSVAPVLPGEEPGAAKARQVMATLPLPTCCLQTKPWPALPGQQPSCTSQIALTALFKILLGKNLENNCEEEHTTPYILSILLFPALFTSTVKWFVGFSECRYSSKISLSPSSFSLFQGFLIEIPTVNGSTVSSLADCSGRGFILLKASPFFISLNLC